MTRGLFSLTFCMAVNTRVNSSQAYTRWEKNSDMITSLIMNPFITRWDEPFAGKEKLVFTICLHGL